MKTKLEITWHAVNRYRQRAECLDKSCADVRSILSAMASDPDSMKVTAKGQILHCGGWLLIRIENRIVTVYKGDEARMLHQKVKGRNNENKKPPGKYRK